MTRRPLLILAAGLAALALPAAARAEGPGFRLHRVGGRFHAPVYVTAPPKDRHRVFVVEQSGVVRVVKDGRTRKRPFLDLRDRVRFLGEQGLLSIAFPPDYASSREVYAFYTDEGQDEVVAAFPVPSSGHADASGERVLLREDDPAENHNGGQLQFGPDGELYVANGDGGGLEASLDPYGLAQDLASPFGKVLRLAPHAAQPVPEVYLRGLRNPWRFSFDRQTGAMVVTDVGRNIAEEVNWLPRGKPAGANLGWPAFEGRTRTGSPVRAPGAIEPVLTFNHTSDNFCAITGGYVSRDPRVPATRGRYLLGDFCRGDVFLARLGRQHVHARDSGVHVDELVSFGEDARARVYVVSRAGRVYRIVRRRRLASGRRAAASRPARRARSRPAAPTSP